MKSVSVVQILSSFLRVNQAVEKLVDLLYALSVIMSIVLSTDTLVNRFSTWSDARYVGELTCVLFG